MGQLPNTIVFHFLTRISRPYAERQLDKIPGKLRVKPETYRYKNLIKANTPYAERMHYLSQRIFGEVSRPTSMKSMKVVKRFGEEPRYKMDNFVKYYPRHTEMGYLFQYLRQYGLLRDEHMDFKEEMDRLKALRGVTKFCWGRNKRVNKGLLE